MNLASGIEKFQTLVFPHMKRSFTALKSGQSPTTLFITCSDSRIDPNLVTQTQPGELFVIRNAGNIVPKPGTGELSVEATIQFAVDVLKVSQIVVCGHSHCGVVDGLLNPDSLESLPIIKKWVMKNEQVLERIGNGADRMEIAVEANVLLQLENLLEHPCVALAVSENRLEIHGWVYHFENGKVDFLNQDTNVV